MNQTQIQTLVNKQRDFFYTGKTLDISYRIQALQKLKACISQNEEAISQAILSDLGKSSFESYMCETGLVLSEISYMLKHIRSLSRESGYIHLLPSSIPEAIPSPPLTVWY